MKVINITKGNTPAVHCTLAGTFFKRFLGLMGKKTLPEGEALLLPKCPQIHMFFMKFPLDAVFLDGEGRVVFIVENLPPWRISPYVKRGRDVLELPSGTVKKFSLEVGDILKIE